MRKLLFVALLGLFAGNIIAQNTMLKENYVSPEEEAQMRKLYHQNNPAKGPGDDCASAIDYGSVNGAAMNGSIVSYGEMWYSFTAAEDMNVTVSLCNSNYDTKLEIWSDCGNGSYDYYNDDACGTRSEISNIPFASGETMYAKVYGYSSASGDYELEVTGAPVAPPVPLSNWAFAIIGMLAVGFVFLKFRK